MTDERTQERDCPKCGERVTYGATGAAAGPGVTMCQSCGTEVPFGGGGAGEMGGRVAVIDRTMDDLEAPHGTRSNDRGPAPQR